MPKITVHDEIMVVRDDLYLGGTKKRFIKPFISKHPALEFVYASPAEGGAQTSLAQACLETGKKATIFVAKRAILHPRALMVKRLGGKIVQVPHGYLNVVQSAATKYAEKKSAFLLPFGMDMPEAIAIISKTAISLGVTPDEVWCAAGSGTLARALALAWPKAKRHVVQVGRELKKAEVGGARIHIYPREFKQHAMSRAPFPSDPHYDEKAWEVCLAKHGKGKILFFNVTGPAA